MFGYILAVVVGLVILFGIYKLVAKKSTPAPYVPPTIDNTNSNAGGEHRTDKTPPEKF